MLFAAEADKTASSRRSTLATRWNNIWPSKQADFMSASYLENKRHNARILATKVAPSKERMYVRSISHSGGEALPDGRRGEIRSSTCRG